MTEDAMSIHWVSFAECGSCTKVLKALPLLVAPCFHLSVMTCVFVNHKSRLCWDITLTLD